MDFSSLRFSLRKNAQLTGRDTCVAVSIRSCQSTGEKRKVSTPTKDPNLLYRTYIRYVKNAHICTFTARSPCHKVYILYLTYIANHQTRQHGRGSLVRSKVTFGFAWDIQIPWGSIYRTVVHLSVYRGH